MSKKKNDASSALPPRALSGVKGGYPPHCICGECRYCEERLRRENPRRPWLRGGRRRIVFRMRPALVCLFLVAACGGGGNDRDTPDELLVGCADLADTFYAAPPSGGAAGEIFRCRFEKTLTAAELGGTSGANVYRIAYRTTRFGGAAGASAAWVLVPTVPRAEVMPIVVAAHGTVGLGETCGPTRREIATQELPTGLAAGGWLVVAPDYAGFGFGDAVHGWSLSEDEAFSLFDAVKAVRALLPAGRLAEDVAFVGHSQGGHAVFAAQSLVATHPLDGNLRAVVGLAPLWFAPRTWGALLTPSLALDTASYRDPFAYSILYYYGHGELYDGPGGGLAMFRPEKRAAIEQAVTSGCYASVASAVTSLGTIAADFYDPDFAARVSDCAGFDSGCDDELAARWFARFRADRPPLDDAGAPVLFWHGGADVTIPPGRARCAIDKVTAEMGTRATICGDPDADHGTIVPQAMPFVSSWLGARLLGEPEPAACAGIEALGPGADVCAMPPPNVD